MASNGVLGGLLLPAQEEARRSAIAISTALASSFPLHTAKHCRDYTSYLPKTFPT